MRSHPCAARAGFTLMELVVAMALVATFATLAAPALGGLIERHRNAAAMHRLTASLALARISAVRTGRPVSVCPSGDGRHCRPDRHWENGWLVFEDPRRNGEPSTSSAIIESSGGIGAGLAMRTTKGRTRVTYDALGWSAGSNVTFSICSAAGWLLATVVVNNAGRARTERPEGRVPCPG